MKHQKTFYGIMILVLILLSSMGTYAATNNTFQVITSQPTSIRINQNYFISWNVTDTTNATINTTALLWKNNVNTLNKSYTNTFSIPNGSNSYNWTIYNPYDGANYTVGDTLWVNITTVESGNFSARNSTASNTLTVLESSTVLVARDSLNFLPGWGSAIGSFATALVPAILTIVVVFLIIGVIVVILIQVSKMISNSWSNTGLMRSKK